MARPVDEGGTAYGTNPVPTIGAQLYDNGPFSYGIPMSLFPGEQPRAVTYSEEEGGGLVDSQWYPYQGDSPAEAYDNHPGYTGTAGWWGAPQEPPTSGPVVNYEDTLVQPEYIQYPPVVPTVNDNAPGEQLPGAWWYPGQQFEDGSQAPPLMLDQWAQGEEWVSPGDSYEGWASEAVPVAPEWYGQEPDYGTSTTNFLYGAGASLGQPQLPFPVRESMGIPFGLAAREYLAAGNAWATNAASGGGGYAPWSNTVTIGRYGDKEALAHEMGHAYWDPGVEWAGLSGAQFGNSFSEQMGSRGQFIQDVYQLANDPSADPRARQQAREVIVGYDGSLGMNYRGEAGGDFSHMYAGMAGGVGKGIVYPDYLQRWLVGLFEP